MASPVGTIGVVTLPTRGPGGPGEVEVPLAGGTEIYFAWSVEPLERGRPVLVVLERGARQVDVVAWSAPSDPFTPESDRS